MEIVMEGKDFRLVSENELPNVAETLVQYLPESLKLHQTIQIYLKEKVWKFHFYVAKNWPQHPICLHFPGTTASLQPNRHPYESVTIFCPSTRTQLLELFTSDNVLPNPTQPLYLNFTNEAIVKYLENHYEVSDDKIYGDLYTYRLDNHTTPASIQDLPRRVEVAPLRPEHAMEVYDASLGNDVECHEMYKKIVDVLPASGVFVEGQLAAWMIQSYYGPMFAMHTKPQFRRRGYGTILARHLMREISARGYKLYAIIRPTNDASRLLYTKLGFEKHFRTLRAMLRPRPRY